MPLSMVVQPALEVIGAWSWADSETTGPPGVSSGRAARRLCLRIENECSASRERAYVDDLDYQQQLTAGGPEPELIGRTRSGALTVRMTADFARLQERTSHERTYGMCQRNSAVTTNPLQDLQGR